MTNPFSHCPNARGGERDVEGNPDYEMGSFALVAGPFLGADGDWAFPEDVHDPIMFEGDLYVYLPSNSVSSSTYLLVRTSSSPSIIIRARFSVPE